MYHSINLFTDLIVILRDCYLFYLKEVEQFSKEFSFVTFSGKKINWMNFVLTYNSFSREIYLYKSEGYLHWQ